MDTHIEDLRDHADEQDQMGRQHILMVNRDPILLDLVRVMLDDARYNVTTTNAVPRTFALIAAARPSLIIIDLEITQQSGWDLLIRLHNEARTAAIPVIVTARDPQLLRHAHRYAYLFGGQVYLAIPFSVATLIDAVQALIGAVATLPGDAQTGVQGGRVADRDGMRQALGANETPAPRLADDGAGARST